MRNDVNLYITQRRRPATTSVKTTATIDENDLDRDDDDGAEKTKKMVLNHAKRFENDPKRTENGPQTTEKRSKNGPKTPEKRYV